MVSYVRYYVMTAKDGESEALRTALTELAGKVAPLDGCDAIELYRDADTPERFHFLERWQSLNAHKEGGKALGKEVFAPVTAALASSPEASSLTPIELA